MTRLSMEAPSHSMFGSFCTSRCRWIYYIVCFLFIFVHVRMYIFRKSTTTIGGLEDSSRKAVMSASFPVRWSWRTWGCRRPKCARPNSTRARRAPVVIWEPPLTTCPEVAHLPRPVCPFPIDFSLLFIYVYALLEIFLYFSFLFLIIHNNTLLIVLRTSYVVAYICWCYFRWFHFVWMFLRVFILYFWLLEGQIKYFVSSRYFAGLRRREDILV